MYVRVNLFERAFLLIPVTQLPGYSAAAPQLHALLRQYVQPILSSEDKDSMEKPNPEAADVVFLFSDESRSAGYSAEDLRALFNCGFFSDVREIMPMPSLVCVKNSIKGLENFDPPIENPFEEEEATCQYALLLFAQAFNLPLLVEAPNNKAQAGMGPDTVLSNIEHKGAIGQAIKQRLRSLCFFPREYKGYRTIERICKWADDVRRDKYHFSLKKLCLLMMRKCVVGKIESLIILSDLRKNWIQWEKKAQDLLHIESRYQTEDKYRKRLIESLKAQITQLEQALPEDNGLLNEPDLEKKPEVLAFYCYKVIVELLNSEYISHADETIVQTKCKLITVNFLVSFNIRLRTNSLDSFLGLAGFSS